YLQGSLDGSAVTAPASGAMAAIYSLSDAAAGIWRSPSGTGYPLNATGLTLNLSTADSDLLNTHNINAIRQFPGTGIVPWGARVLDRSNSGNLYVPVVRTRLWASASIQRALAFAATEDDGDPLWSQIRAMVGDFLYGLFQRGAFAGTTSSTSYFVKCDSSTTTAADIAANRVNCYYGMALLRSAEFDMTSLTAKTYDSTLVPTSPTIDCGTAGPSLVLAYPTLPGLNYQLNSSVGLSSAIWTNIGTTAPGDGAWQRLIVATTNSLGFYRVSVSPAR
ncbi:MAG TPA: hypothetical protein VHI52_08070, partial [Verrucomicrobiae bacterium]|nr:hypothetical protein [Verrucomicrobiae bacterium]